MNIDKKIKEAEEGVEFWENEVENAQNTLEEFEDDVRYYKEQKRKGQLTYDYEE
jgi:hypothetical protein